MRSLLYGRMPRVLTAVAVAATFSMMSGNVSAVQAKSSFDISPPTQQAYTPDIVGGIDMMSDVPIIIIANIDEDPLSIGQMFVHLSDDPALAMSVTQPAGADSLGLGTSWIDTPTDGILGNYGYSPYASVSNFTSNLMSTTSLANGNGEPFTKKPVALRL